jgi:predicted ribonuclease toxin of YeeF-YezG toxin-antitoxin module
MAHYSGGSRTGEMTAAPDIYGRPSFRAGMRESVWDAARDAEYGVRDPTTGAVMSPSEPWDMGHRPGYEFWKHQVSASERGISRQTFIDEYNTAAHYRPELPSSNRNHRGELRSREYFGH